MSIDAGWHLRWPKSQAPTLEELAEALGLRAPADERGWRKVAAVDGSIHWVRISADAYDRLGPSAAGEGSSPGFPYPEKAYDYWLHISPGSLGPEVENTHSALRAYCREAIDTLRGRYGLAESAFDVDWDCYTSYWTDFTDLFGPCVQGELELDVWWAAAAQLDVSPALVVRALPPGLQLTTVGRDQVAGRIVPAAQATDAIAESLGFRATELSFHDAVRITGTDVPVAAVDAFTERLIAELVTRGQETDVAVWVNGRICRYEVALPPATHGSC